MKNIIIGVLIVATCLAVTGMPDRLLPDYTKPFVGGPLTTKSSGPTVESVRRISEMMTLRVTISDVLEGEGYGYRGAWLVKGDAAFGINAEEIEVPASLMDYDSQTATVILPSPRLTYARVDHECTKTYDVARARWYTIPSQRRESRLRDESMREAQRLIAHAAKTDEHIRQAKDHAARTIQRLYEPFGWTITVQWVERGEGNGPLLTANLTSRRKL